MIFELQPADALINDINKALINVYQQICHRPKEFIQKVKELDEGLAEYGVEEPGQSKSKQKVAKEKEAAKQYYYAVRKQYNDRLVKEQFDADLAARFVFLNKHCFNGLYRVNGQGLFNVPYNNSVSPSIDETSIQDISAYLQKVTILEGDFEAACREAGEGDFVFIDSPYAPLNPSSFESYTKEGFDLESHKRLARLFDELTKRGCYCMLTNHNTELIHELYGGKQYQVDVVGVKRLINSDATKRVGEEVIIYNYK